MTAAPEPSAEVTDAKLLRRVFGKFATGVTIVTVGAPTPHGMTANSFTSVSLDPPLVLICIDRTAIMHRSLAAASYFGISVLAAGQESIARQFADRWRPLGQAQFDAVDWLPGRITGVPLIGGAVARFECQLWSSYEGGDHTIFVGRLLTMDRPPGDEDSLLFFGGRFRQLNPEQSEVTA